MRNRQVSMLSTRHVATFFSLPLPSAVWPRRKATTPASRQSSHHPGEKRVEEAATPWTSTWPLRARSAANQRRPAGETSHPPLPASFVIRERCMRTQIGTASCRAFAGRGPRSLAECARVRLSAFCRTLVLRQRGRSWSSEGGIGLLPLAKGNPYIQVGRYHRPHMQPITDGLDLGMGGIALTLKRCGQEDVERQKAWLDAVRWVRVAVPQGLLTLSCRQSCPFSGFVGFRCLLRRTPGHWYRIRTNLLLAVYRPYTL